MICISVTPSSRTLAPADMLNAARHGDLIELCLDHFLKEPNVSELVKATDKPVLVSCRRPKEGGRWKGSDHERVALLRNAIVAGPAYVELDIETAEKIPRFGETKRVVSYTSLERPLAKVDEILDACLKARADVIKITWPTGSLDAAWPMLVAVSQPRDVPVVGFGIGHAGLTFSLLGRRYGSPWIYAALERGMEAFPEQPTVWQLRDDYGLNDIGPKTRFLGIIGFGQAENATARILNAAFRIMDKPIRCLPLMPDDLSRLPKMLSVMKINGLIVDPSYSGDLSSLAAPRGEIAEVSGYIDVITERKEGWCGSATLPEAVDLAGRRVLNSENWAGKGAIMICGTGTTAKAMAKFFSTRGGAVSLAGPSDNRAAAAAREVGVRHVTWNGLHDIRVDTLVIADADMPCGSGKGALNPMAIRQNIVVVDLTKYPRESDFAEEARMRGARLVDPSSIFTEQLNVQFRALAGRDLPEDAVRLGLQDV